MSHYNVTVVLSAAQLADRKLDDVLGEVMERWNENREVEPYWSVETDASAGTPAEADAYMYGRLVELGLIPQGLTDWQTYAEACVKYLAEDEDEKYVWDLEKLQIKRETTYNPESKWDWWAIGGRWPRRWLRKNGSRADVIRVGDLDVEQMRDEAERKVRGERAVFEDIITEHGRWIPWKDFVARVESGELEIEAARRDYYEQPAMRAIRRDAELRGYWEVDDYLDSADELAERARWGAVSTYAMVTKEGEWVAPGRMGWFGLSTDAEEERVSYDTWFDSYVAALDPDDVLVLLDLHI